MRIIAQVVIGYMYKVMKNGIDTSLFKEEFAAIRHGDYKDFLQLIGDELDFIVTYNAGEINTDTNIRDDDSDFGRLIKSGESLKTFWKKCFNEFGKIEDSDISDEIYEKLALFELGLRMHRNNKTPKEERITLQTVINHLQEIKGLSDSEVDSLHKGRRFLNNVKRPKNMKSSWIQGLNEFDSAYMIIKSKKITII